MKLPVLALVMFSMSSVAVANEVQINITGKEERKSYDDSPLCELAYDITNNSTGTIYYLRVSIDAWDDRGDKYDEMLVSSLDNGGGFRGRTPIPVGSTAKFKMDNGFKGRCEYLQKVAVTEIKPEYCNIRMLPEEADCRNIVAVTSSVEGLVVEN